MLDDDAIAIEWRNLDDTDGVLVMAAGACADRAADGSGFQQMKLLKGFTLVEMMVTLAVMSILLTIAVPSYRDAIERLRIKSSAETLQNNFYVAKTESLKSGKSAYFSVRAGACYGFKLGAPCDCQAASSDANYCPLLRTLVSTTEPVALLSTSFPDGVGSIESVRGMSTSGDVTWKSKSGYVAKTAITVVGRVRVCSPAGAGNVGGYPSDNC